MRSAIRLFAVDCEAEVEKIARAAPGAKVFCRILCDGGWRGMAAVAQVRLRASNGGRRARARASHSDSIAHGLSFHVGSQQRNPRVGSGAEGFGCNLQDLAERGIQLAMINLGGGFPTRC